MISSLDPDFGDLAELRTKMLRWARRFDRRNTEDLVQTAFVRMLASRARYDKSCSAETWAFAVLRNTYLNLARRARQERRYGGEFPDVATLVAVDNPETQTYCRQVLRHALRLEVDVLFGGEGKSPTDRVRQLRRRRQLAEVAA